MTDVLIYADTTRSPAMRHEIPLAVPDPFLYVEHDGRRLVVVTSFERERLRPSRPTSRPCLRSSSGSTSSCAEARRPSRRCWRSFTRALSEIGVSSVGVPAQFPLELADRLRANGVDDQRRPRPVRGSTPEQERERDRRPPPRAARVRGRRSTSRARCCATPPVTAFSSTAASRSPCELIKAEMQQVFVSHGAIADEFIVAPGAQGAVGHDMGSGPIASGVSVVFDLWPRDRETAVLHRHDAHVRRRRRPGRDPRVPPALQGGARVHDRGCEAGRERARS